MTPQEIAEALGGHDTDEMERVLASLGPDSGHAVALAIRAGFEGGDERGNCNRLIALVRIEGKGALDVVRDVLEDTTEVGGIYSNLRNTALELISAHFQGDPSLEKSLRRAMEIDPYMSPTFLAPVLEPFDPEHALSLYLVLARRGDRAAMKMVATQHRAKLLEQIDSALESDDANPFIEALEDDARAPDIFPKIAAKADALPSAALIVAKTDAAFARKLADKLRSKDWSWRDAAARALATLPAAEIFDFVSPMLEADDRTKPNALDRLEHIYDALEALEDPRWEARFRERLIAEESPKMREVLVPFVGLLGARAVDAILSAPRDDKDKKVIAAMLDTLMNLKGDAKVLEAVRAASAAAGKKGARAKAIREALDYLELPTTLRD